MLICQKHVYYIMSICVMCLKIYDEKDVNLQRKIVNDEDFCNDCWTEVMNIEWDESRIIIFDYVNDYKF